MNRFFLTFTLLIYGSVSFAQNETNTTFSAGEKLNYIVSFNVSGLWSDIAEVDMKVKSAKSGTKELYNLQLIGKTYSSWDSYFKVRDSYQSWIDPITMKPYLFKRSVSEGGINFNWKYVFKRKSLTAKATRSEKGKNDWTKTVKINANTLDIASVIYYMRNLDFENATKNKIYKLSVIVDAKVININIKYLGIETINNKYIGTKQCYKLGVFLDDDKIVKNSNSNNIWLTTDSKKVPVLIKAEIPVGSIQLNLAKIE